MVRDISPSEGNVTDRTLSWNVETLPVDAFQGKSLSAPIVHSHLITPRCSSATFIKSLVLLVLTDININPLGYMEP